MLKNGIEHQDLGAQRFAYRDHAKSILPLVRRHELGCVVEFATAA
jgi:hypothetical protein